MKLKELSQDELITISGGGIMYSIGYGIGYVAGQIVNGIDAAVSWFAGAVHK